jgi:predicted DNA-binding transcriptional regulator AlpA
MEKRSQLLASIRLAGSNIPGTCAIAERKTAAPTDDPLIGTSEVARELMCHPVSVFRYLRERPEFPVPIRISSNRLAWRLSVIRAYVASRPLRETRNETASPPCAKGPGPRASSGQGR